LSKVRESFIYLSNQNNKKMNSETLTVILWDAKTKDVVEDMILPFNSAYRTFNASTIEYENKGWMMVNEINVDTNTIVRQFATEKDGHLFDLIICGGRVVNGSVTRTNKN
jgi:hypothetical protein